MQWLSKLLFSVFLINVLVAPSLAADTDLENAALARIIAVLNSLTPLINSAEEQQDKTTRVQFHYEILRNDIDKIKQGITQKLQPEPIEPRTIDPIQGDYLLPLGKTLTSKK